MARADFLFAYPKRVRYAEVDPQAVVFNSRYLEYLDIGITEYWREVGLPVSGGFQMHVARTLIEYKKPLRVDELFDICLRVSRIGRSSMTTLWEIHGVSDDDLRASGETVAVHVDLASGKPQPIPDDIAKLFETYEKSALRTETRA